MNSIELGRRIKAFELSRKFIRLSAYFITAASGLGVGASGCKSGPPSVSDAGQADGGGDAAADVGPGTDYEGTCCDAGYYRNRDIGECVPCPPKMYSEDSNEWCIGWCMKWLCEGWTMSRVGTAKTDTECEKSNIRQFGTSGADYARGIAVDEVGAVYVVGETWGDLGGPSPSAQSINRYYGGADAYIRKYSYTGELIWSLQFGTPENDSAHTVLVDTKGDIWVAGSTEGQLGAERLGGVDIFLRKYSQTGELLLSRQFGGALRDEAASMIFGLDEAIYVGGLIGAEGGAAGGDTDGAVWKFAPSGEMLWQRLVQSENNRADSVRALEKNSIGQIYAVGDTRGSLDGEPEGAQSVFVAGFEEGGEPLGIQQLRGAGDLYAKGVMFGRYDVLYIVGDTFGDLVESLRGKSDGFIAQFRGFEHPFGDLSQFGDEGAESVLGIGEGRDDKLIIVMTSTKEGEPNSVTIHLDLHYVSWGIGPTPLYSWQQAMPGAFHGDRVSISNGRYFYVSGHTSSALGGEHFGGIDGVVAEFEFPQGFYWPWR